MSLQTIVNLKLRWLTIRIQNGTPSISRHPCIVTIGGPHCVWMMMMVRRQWTEIAFSCLPFCGRLSSPLRANRMKWAKVSCFAKMYPTQPLNNSKMRERGRRMNRCHCHLARMRRDHLCLTKTRFWGRRLLLEISKYDVSTGPRDQQTRWVEKDYVDSIYLSVSFEDLWTRDIDNIL